MTAIDCFCDYNPPTFYDRVVRTARKVHQCYECGGKIAVGEKYENVAGLWEGSFSVFKTCERCVDIRTWVKNSVPCFCWAHGNMTEDAKETVEEAAYRAPQETVGLRFGLLRRIELRDRFNASRKAAAA